MTILESGINLMLYGMGTVFVFLSILILTTMAMSRFIGRFMPQNEQVPPVLSSQDIPTEATGIDPKLLSILQAAIRAHKES